RIVRRRLEHAEDDVAVEEQRHPRVDRRTLGPVELLRPVVALAQRPRRRLRRRRWRRPPVLERHRPLRMRPAAVIEDRARPVEPLARQALLVAQLAAFAQRDVVLLGDGAGDATFEHDDLLGYDILGYDIPGYDTRACSPRSWRCCRSMLSKS